MASWNIVSYYHNNANQQYYYFSIGVSNYDITGSTESYVVNYQGFTININMFRILASGYIQVKYKIEAVNSSNEWNCYLFTYRSYYNAYTSKEIDLALNEEQEMMLEYTRSTENTSHSVYLNFDFYKTQESHGYEQGWTAGFDSAEDLYETGNQDFNGTFTLIGSAFNSLSGILETQVIGGLTIGALIGIPLTITILVTIFRIMRK